MKKALVTGGTGALGRAVIARMKKLGSYDIIAAGRQYRNDDPSGIRCDVRDPEQLSAAFDQAKPDLVLHLAATFSGDLPEAYSTNVAPAQHILDWVQRKGLKTRIILIGSAAEYGVVSPVENPIREDHVLAPVSVYGISKAWQTQLLGLYAYQGVEVVCARVFNLYGPGISDRLFVGRLQHQINEVVARKRSIIDVGPLSAIRDYLSTDEAATQLLTIAALGVSGRVYHVASGVPVTVRDILMRHLEAHGLDLSIVREAPSLSNRNGYDVPAIFADMTKTNQLETAGGGNA
ncbi:MAG: NAD-dependent epimerase/dehydratase family protein [Candidatus Manganitrophus sp. SB1]|nr:NAD-dependent epimerase/dehydratase family protein [Candidatus Manganitrophus morganii]